jgi:5-methylcytosine-specific restriction endonuclease McrA
LARSVFSAKVKEAAWRRSGGVCEAVGAIYGLEAGIRCTTILEPGKYDRDHYPLPAHAEGSNTLENCWCICKVCHLFKTRTFDTPFEAKLKRSLRKRGLGPKPPKVKAKIPSPAKRANPIPQRANAWGKGRKLQSRSFRQLTS